MSSLTSFIHPNQLRLIRSLSRGEEGQHYKDKQAELRKVINDMPATYGQRDVKDPIVYLHYFYAGCDWYITEKDSEAEQLQAYGYTILNGNDPEPGYISLVELIQSKYPIEIDLYFTPKPASKIPKLAELFLEATPEESEPQITDHSSVTTKSNIIPFPAITRPPLTKRFPFKPQNSPTTTSH